MHTYTIHIESAETARALKRFVDEHNDAVMFEETDTEIQTWKNKSAEEQTAVLQGLEDLEAGRTSTMEEVKNMANVLLGK